MLDRATPEAVVADYAELINRHDFELLTPLIDDDVTFWFSSGSYHGMEAARAAFQRTWQRLADETYWLEDLRWIAKPMRQRAASIVFIGKRSSTGRWFEAAAEARPCWASAPATGAFCTSI